MKLLSLLSITLLCLAAGPASRPGTPPARVAYVIDASQSMKPKFADARDAVLAAVKDLPTDTQFAVVVDIGDVQQRYPQAGLGPASDVNKTGVERFLKNERLVPKGDGHLDVAVATACKMKVAAVWLYSDGDFPINSEQVVKHIIATAKENKVAIHTSLTLAGTRKREEILLQIAKDTGGTCLNDKGEAVTELPPEPSKTVKPGQNIFDTK